MYDPDKAINDLYEETQQLKAELLAHQENEGDECPLCQLEAENEALSTKYEKLLLLTGVFLDKICVYAGHKRSCTWDDGTKGDICTCGFRPLIRELYAAQDVYTDILEGK